MKGKKGRPVLEYGYDARFCARCGERFHRDRFGNYREEVAEVVDEEGEHLLVHYNGCMRETDQLA